MVYGGNSTTAIAQSTAGSNGDVKEVTNGSSGAYKYAYTTNDVVNGSTVKEISGISDEIKNSIQDSYTYAKVTLIGGSNADSPSTGYIGDIIRQY